MISSLNLHRRQIHALIRRLAGIESDRIRYVVSRVFAISVFLVAITSCYDAFLVYQYRAVIHEQNPICEWLISLEPNHVSVFLLGKGLGTLCVVSILVGLYKRRRQLAIPVAVSLVLFQTGLMTYLHHSEGRKVNTRRVAANRDSLNSAMPVGKHVPGIQSGAMPVSRAGNVAVSGRAKRSIARRFNLLHRPPEVNLVKRSSRHSQPRRSGGPGIKLYGP